MSWKQSLIRIYIVKYHCWHFIYTINSYLKAIIPVFHRHISTWHNSQPSLNNMYNMFIPSFYRSILRRSVRTRDTIPLETNKTQAFNSAPPITVELYSCLLIKASKCKKGFEQIVSYYATHISIDNELLSSMMEYRIGT